MSFKVPPALSSEHASLLRNKTKSTQWGQSQYKVAFEIAKFSLERNQLLKKEINVTYWLFDTKMDLRMDLIRFILAVESQFYLSSILYGKILALSSNNFPEFV
jgi:hypothetical protein